MKFWKVFIIPNDNEKKSVSKKTKNRKIKNFEQILIKIIKTKDIIDLKINVIKTLTKEHLELC